MTLVLPKEEHGEKTSIYEILTRLAEGVGFEPTVRLPVRLISSQVPLTTQPPFRTVFTGLCALALTVPPKSYHHAPPNSAKQQTKLCAD